MEYPQNLTELFKVTGTIGDILNMEHVENAIKEYSRMVKEKICGNCKTCGDKLDEVDLLREHGICNQCLSNKEKPHGD